MTHLERDDTDFRGVLARATTAEARLELLQAEHAALLARAEAAESELRKRRTHAEGVEWEVLNTYGDVFPRDVYVDYTQALRRLKETAQSEEAAEQREQAATAEAATLRAVIQAAADDCSVCGGGGRMPVFGGMKWTNDPCFQCVPLRAALATAPDDGQRGREQAEDVPLGGRLVAEQTLTKMQAVIDAARRLRDSTIWGRNDPATSVRNVYLDAIDEALMALDTPSDYKPIGPAMRELRELAGPYFDGVDVYAYMHDVRGDDDPPPAAGQEE